MFIILGNEIFPVVMEVFLRIQRKISKVFFLNKLGSDKFLSLLPGLI